MTLKCKNPYFDENIDRKFVFLLYSVLIAKGINLGEKFDGLFISDDKVGILETHLDYEIAVLKEVSVYEAFEHCIPDGMRYNKELDKLVPDIMQWKKEDNGGNHIAVDGTSFDTLEEALNHNCTLIATSSADEYCSGIKVEFEKVLEYSEEILQRENGFIKADKEKINFSLVDPYAYEDLGKCLTIGAKKYSPDNWKIGDIESYIAALDRHLIDIKKAVLDKDKSLFIDKDTTLQHGANLLCNAMFIHYFIRKELEEDKC